MGRKPLPTAVKKLRGNPGKRKLNDAEPKPSGVATCPRWLSDEARKEWKRVAPGLKAMGMMTELDRSALAAYCQAYARWLEAEKQIAKFGMVIKTQSGNAIQNPYVGAANRAMEIMQKFASEFGMTPSSRSRLQITAPVQTDDGWDDFLADVPAGDSIAVN